MYANDTLTSQESDLVNKENHGLSEYERQRQENIARNQAMLKALDIESLVPNDLNDVNTTSNVVDKGRKKKQPRTTTPSNANATPRRVSARLRGDAPAVIPLSTDGSAEPDIPAINYVTDDLTGILLTADQYFDEETKATALRVDGHFSGWVNKDMIEKYGLEANAADAWKNNGGGTFSYRDPSGSAGSSSMRKLGRKVMGNIKEAKLIAKMLFRKNPNAYFYRHNEPGEEQWTGDWSQEEEDLFVQIAREYGCGDKWGLFASYIPHRVGYQCSNHYRQVIYHLDVLSIQITRQVKAILVYVCTII
ncbi:hypothetical protein BDF22DRAFT_696204 [Syncephalis plumigaleata]|nr:hypothetical protein BDF22DRAFT_696204 [Syncephalis plumigaleata]